MTTARIPFLLAWLFLSALGLAAQDTTVVLLRHAERQSIFDGDSPLAEAGLRRAGALAPLLAGFHPAALYASELKRTQQTLAPTAARTGLVPILRPKDGSAALAAEILREHRGRTVVICWHHDLMKKVVRALGVKGPVSYWPLGTYDWIWIVTIPAQGEARLVEKVQEPGSVFKVDASRDAAQPRAWQGGGRRAMRDIVRGPQRSQGCGWAASRRARGGARRDTASSSSSIVPLSPSSLSLPRLGGAPCAATPHFENRP